MIDLPMRFPADPFCRAGTRLMLTMDEAGGECFLGVTPDGTQPGRDMLARMTLWQGESQVPYTVSQENGALALHAGCGYVNLELGLPERLVVEGEGVSLLIGKGRALGMFMSGGSAVDDALPGALYVNAGVRMRVLPKTGSVEVRSAWNLNALSDPDPRVLLHPDESGRLEAAVYVTDFDEVPAEADAPAAGEDFEAFLRSLIAYPEDPETLHAAYVVWSCLQPARTLADPQIAAPLYVSNRRSRGTAMLSDNVLLAAMLKDPEEAARQMCAFLDFADSEGLLPRAADNRSRLYEVETPYFGVVLRARPDIQDVLTAGQYEQLSLALDWWRHKRFCQKEQQFFYLHRYEPGFGKTYPFPDDGVLCSPILNACMRMWLEGMEQPARRQGCGEEADACRALADMLPEAISFDAPVPAALELPVLLVGDAAAKNRVRERLRAEPGAITSLRRALTVLAAGLTEKGGA